MRAALAAALTLALTACTPAPPPSQPAAEPPAAPPTPSPSAAAAPTSAADAAALAAAPLPDGQWFFRADESVFAAGFGAPQSEFQFAVSCNGGSGAVQIMSAHELAPDQPVTLTIVTAAQTIDLAANSFNEGLASVNAELADAAPEKAALIAALTQTQARIGVRVRDETHVYAWDEALTRALAPCR